MISVFEALALGAVVYGWFEIRFLHRQQARTAGRLDQLNIAFRRYRVANRPRSQNERPE